MRPWKIVKPLADGTTRITYQDPRTEPGELLWPGHVGAVDVAKLKEVLGPFAQCQLQQDPVSSLGGIFKEEWLKYWSPGGAVLGTVALPPFGIDCQSWDCAFKGKDSSDPVCGGLLRRAGSNFFLVEVLAWGRMGFNDTVDAVEAACRRWPRVLQKYVEGKANGSAVVEVLQSKYPGFEEVEPEGGKEARAHAVTPLMRGGFFFLPHPSTPAGARTAELVAEMKRFPRGLHDDGVDMITQGLLKLYQGSSLAAAMGNVLKDPALRKMLGGG